MAPKESKLTLSIPGPALVGLGSILWATDALFRAPAVQKLDPTWIVWAEHLIGTAVLLPYFIFKGRQKLSNLQWFGLFVIGAGASGVATVLFTASFRYVDASVAILLQKLQPIVVVLTAYAFLGERPAKKFFLWAPLALLAAVFLTFPNLDAYSQLKNVNPRSIGVIYALTAAGIWAVATTVGKGLLKTVSTTAATFWRYAFGLGFLSVLLLGAGRSLHPGVDFETTLPIFYMAMIPGVSALLLYYSGLKRTTASVATFTELLFPVTAVVLNHFFLKQQLNLTQILSSAVMLLSVTQISLP